MPRQNRHILLNLKVEVVVQIKPNSFRYVYGHHKLYGKAMKNLSSRIKLLLAFLILLFLFTLNIESCGSDDSSKPGSISGRITGLSGVTVSARLRYYSEGGACSGPGYVGRSASTVTDSNGNYIFYTADYTGEFEGTATGTIEAHKNGYSFEPESREISVGYYSTIGGQDFVATPLSYSISGSIVKVDGTGMPGVPVELSGAASKSTTTNENGYYTFSGLYLGSYTITPSLISVTPENRSVTIQYNNPTEFISDFTATGQAVSGIVTASDGSPITGVTLSLTGDATATTVSDNDGYFTFQSVYNGSYTITPSPPCLNYAFSPTSHSLIVSDADIWGQDFTGPVLLSDLSGIVTTFDGMALSDVTVSLSDANLTTTTTDSSGYYIFTSVHAGTYDVLPSSPGYYFAPADIALCSTDVTGFDFTATVTMAKTYGSGYFRDIRTTSDGGYVVAGYTNSYGRGDYELWVLKLDESSNVVWEKTYGKQYDDYFANSIQETSDGGYVVAGKTNSNLSSSDKSLVVKLDGSGDIVWQKRYVGGSANSIQETSDGGYIVAGYTNAYGLGYNFRVEKIDGNGNEVWLKIYGGSSEDRANSIQETSDGGYIVAGYTFSYGSGSYDFWVLKLDGSGNTEWQKTYGGSSEDRGNSIEATSDGGYIVAGYSNSYGSGSYDFWVLKLDGSGNVEWQKAYGDSVSDYAYSIQETSDGGYIVAGYSNSYGSGGYDLWVLKLDGNGNVAWQKTYGGAYLVHSIRETSDGSYVVAGAISGSAAVIKINSSGELKFCSMDVSTNATVTDTNVTPNESAAIVTSPIAGFIDTHAIPQNVTSAEIQLCPSF